MVSPQAIENNSYRKGPPDKLGLAAAQAAQDAARPAVVILFGSRARGDWREHSDIDLLLIIEAKDGRVAEGAAYTAASKYCQSQGITVDVNVVAMTRAEFERCRRAKQHIAGQADTYGVVMSGEELEQREGYEDERPDHWPETSRRIRNAEAWLQGYTELVDADHWSQQMMGFEAQQAVENGLKGILSAHNEAASYDHNLKRCWVNVVRLEAANPTAVLLMQDGQRLFDYVDHPNPERPEGPQDWLTMYATQYRYQEPEVLWSRAEMLELFSLVRSFVERLVEHICHLSGTTASDVYPDGLRPWERHQRESGTASS